MKIPFITLLTLISGCQSVVSMDVEQRDHRLNKRLFLGVCNDPSKRLPIPFLDSNWLIQSLTVPTLDLSLTSNSQPAGLVSADNVKVDLIQLPSPVRQLANIAFEKIQQSLELVPPGSNQSVAVLEMEQASCKGSMTTGLQLNMNNLPLTVTNEEGFAQFLKQVTFAEGPMNVTMRGNAVVTAKPLNEVKLGGWTIKMGFPVCLSDLKFNKPFVVEGMKGLKKGKVLQVPSVVNPFDIPTPNGQEQETSGVYLRIPFELDNPSNVRLQTQGIHATLLYHKEPIGRVYIPQLDLQPHQASPVDVVAVVNPTNENAKDRVKQLFSRFANGQMSLLQIAGHEESTSLDYLKPALKDWNMETLLPGLPSKLVDSAVFSAPNLFNMVSNAKITATNPFAVPVRILRIKGTMYRQTQPIATIDQTLDHEAFVLQPLAKQVVSPLLKLKVLLQWGLLWELASSGKLVVDLWTEIDMTIGGFPVTIDYRQADLKTNFQFSLTQ